mgnify:CR=1 FL=1
MLLLRLVREGHIHEFPQTFLAKTDLLLSRSHFVRLGGVVDVCEHFGVRNVLWVVTVKVVMKIFCVSWLVITDSFLNFIASQSFECGLACHICELFLG